MLGVEVNIKSRNPFRHTKNSLHAGISVSVRSIYDVLNQKLPEKDFVSTNSL